MNKDDECPKSGGNMMRGDRLVPTPTHLAVIVTLAKRGDIWGDDIIPYYCENCGFIELYKEMEGTKQIKHHNAFLRRCVKCSKEIPIASEECRYCGAKQPNKIT